MPHERTLRLPERVKEFDHREDRDKNSDDHVDVHRGRAGEVEHFRRGYEPQSRDEIDPLLPNGERGQRRDGKDGDGDAHDDRIRPLVTCGKFEKPGAGEEGAAEDQVPDVAKSAVGPLSHGFLH